MKRPRRDAQTEPSKKTPYPRGGVYAEGYKESRVDAFSKKTDRFKCSTSLSL